MCPHPTASTSKLTVPSGTKKLKCTGEKPSCARCTADDTACVYSVRKRMGRPKKVTRAESLVPSVAARLAPLDATPLLHESGSGLGTSALADCSQPLSDMHLPPPPMHQHSWPDPIFDVDSPQRTSGQQLWTVDASVDRHTAPFELLPDSSFRPGSHSPHDSLDLTQPQDVVPDCACLSSMYLSLHALSSPSLTSSIPYAVSTLREAMQTAASAIDCHHCLSRFITGVQNIQLLGTLLMSIAERLGKVKATIESSDEYALEERVSVVKMLRAEVFGAEGEECGELYFMDLVRRLRVRQEWVHSRPLPDDCPEFARGHPILGTREAASGPGGGLQCVKMAGYAEMHLEAMDWH